MTKECSGKEVGQSGEWDKFNGDRGRITTAKERTGNRRWREDPVAAINLKNFDVPYTYDGANRLTNIKRADLNDQETALWPGR
jgi:hypothetical protein